MNKSIFIYIFAMAITTFAIRVIPLTCIRTQIKNRTIRSFLFYVPYVTLAVMTFPAILSASGNIYSAVAALIVGSILAWFDGSLFKVAVLSCIVVFFCELLFS